MLIELVEGRDHEGSFLLNIIVAQIARIFKLLTREDETLLIGRSSIVASNRVGLEVSSFSMVSDVVASERASRH